ncbi:MAG: IclR family transcriptional regulator [Lachnospiraceae bacterium]
MDKNEGLIQSVDRALAIMEVLLREPELGVTELSAELGLGKSTVHRLLLTMKVHGLIDQTPSSKYRLGIRLAIFGETVVRRLDLRKEAAPFLADLSKLSGESVSLAILDEYSILYIDRIDCLEPLRMGVKIGLRLPIFCTSMGKAILANLPEQKLNKLFDDSKFQNTLIKYTDNTITELGKLREHLKNVKELGFALDREEHNPGVSCIGAPIFDHLGRVVAAISVAGPTIRMTPDRIEELIPYVKKSAMDISLQLGHQNKFSD